MDFEPIELFHSKDNHNKKSGDVDIFNAPFYVIYKKESKLTFGEVKLNTRIDMSEKYAKCKRKDPKPLTVFFEADYGHNGEATCIECDKKWTPSNIDPVSACTCPKFKNCNESLKKSLHGKNAKEVQLKEPTASSYYGNLVYYHPKNVIDRKKDTIFSL